MVESLGVGLLEIAVLSEESALALTEWVSIAGAMGLYFRSIAHHSRFKH